MILSNGNVMLGDFTLAKCDIEILKGKISAIGEKLSGENRIDMSDKLILPGFIDTHIHGAYGVRISDFDVDLSKMTCFEVSQGVTSVAVTTAASESDNLLLQINKVREASKTRSGAKIAGIHAEGPFLSKKFKGAMNEKNIIAPDTDKLDNMLKSSGGLLKILTIAPEAENADELIRYAVGKGITVSVGHTDATYGQTVSAIDAGATRSTHTFNAMRPFNHREPGVVGAVLTDKRVCCEIICDYVHLHPATVQMIYRTKGADNIVMVSDSGHAAGMNVTEFEVDGITRYVRGGVVRLADGTIAGSAKTLLDGVKNLILSGIPVEDVSKMASLNPARSLKTDNETGSIDIGKCADLAVLDENYDVAYTFVDGECFCFCDK